MKVDIITWKGDYIHLLPNIAICIDREDFSRRQKYFNIKLSFLKGNLGIQITWKNKKTLD